MNRDTRRTRLLLATLLLVSLTLVALDARARSGGSPLDAVRGVAAGVLGPLERAVGSVVDPMRNTAAAVGRLGDDTSRVQELERENAALRLENRTAELARNRAAELDALLKVASLGRYRVVPAQVVAIGPAQGFGQTVTIDAGSRDGVTADMTVLDGQGLVGRVKTAGPFTATVLLVTDPSSTVGVRLEKTLKIGTVTGDGRAPLALELFDATAPVAVSGRLVTLGSRGGRPFVAGVPVGEVLSVKAQGGLTRRATVRPYVDIGSLDLVGVVVAPPRKDPRDAVLPPPPRPVPRPTVTVTVTPPAAPAPRGAASTGGGR